MKQGILIGLLLISFHAFSVDVGITRPIYEKMIANTSDLLNESDFNDIAPNQDNVWAAIMLVQSMEVGKLINSIDDINWHLFSDQRSLNDALYKGEIAISAVMESFAQLDRNQTFIISPPILNSYERRQALYVSLSSRSVPFQASTLKAATLKHWQDEKQHLISAGFTPVETFISYRALFDALKNDTDLMTPMSLSNDENFKRQFSDLEIYPIKNKSIKLQNSYHFALSKNNTSVDKINKAIAKGFKSMRSENRLPNSLFKTSPVYQWTAINH